MKDYSFTQSIINQSIFKRWVTFQNASESGRRIVVRHNRDVFVAVGSAIRVCKLNSKTQGYSILSSNDIVIEEISLNSRGTFIYSTDYKTVFVQSIPQDVGHANSFIHASAETYQLQGIDGKITKIIWHDYVERGLGLVVLQENGIIRLYDLNISKQPCLSVDTSEKFQGKEVPTSISFGSSTNIQGGLTLYISTKSSKLYAIYPFIHHKSKITATRNEIDAAAAQYRYLLDYFAEGINTETLELLNELRAFYEKLESQTRHTTDLELKTLYNKEYFCFISEAPISSDFVHIQGPLANLQCGNIEDIIHLGVDDAISVLACVNSDPTDLTLKYLAQLQPLLITSGNDQLSSSLKKLTIEPKSKLELKDKNSVKKSYRKPDSGFGYLDDSDDSDVEVSADNSFTETLEPLFSSISEISLDILSDVKSGPARSLIPSSIDPYRFIVQSSESSILVTPPDFSEVLKSGTFDENATSYDTIESGNCSVALVKDDVSFSGEYVICQPSLANHDVKVFQVNGPQLLLALELAPILVGDSKTVVIENKKDSSLLQEIKSDVKSCNKINELSHKVGIQDSKVDVLKKLNLFSAETLASISKYETLLLKLHLQIQTNVIDFKNQIELYNSTKLHSSGKLAEDIDEKITTLTSKQEKLDARLKALHQKVVRRIEAIKVKNEIPLSKQERDWFQELEKVQKLVGESSNTGLSEKIEELETEIREFATNVTERSKDPILSHPKQVQRLLAFAKSQTEAVLGFKNEVETLVRQN